MDVLALTESIRELYLPQRGQRPAWQKPGSVVPVKTTVDRSGACSLTPALRVESFPVSARSVALAGFKASHMGRWPRNKGQPRSQDAACMMVSKSCSVLNCTESVHRPQSNQQITSYDGSRVAP